MARYGIICPAATGHLNSIFPLCKELQRRGHSIIFYQQLDAEAQVKNAGFSFRAYGTSEYPLGSIPEIHHQLGKISGTRALKFTINLLCTRVESSLRDIPNMAQEDSIDAFLVDQVCVEGGTIANAIGVPFVTFSSALALNQERGIPPCFTTWSYSRSPFNQLRNSIAYFVLNRSIEPCLKVLNRYRKNIGLPRIRSVHEIDSPLAQICQQPLEFEFPRKRMPAHAHYVGPMHTSEARKSVSFPFEKLTGAPLIYASLGTLQNQLGDIFQCIAEACADLPVQLVLSLGGGSKAESLMNLPGSPLVVEYAPQLEILKKATLCITHAGLNTVLECLTEGVPLIAIPIANDQPGVASRLVWKKVGKLIQLKNLQHLELRKAIQSVLSDKTFAQNAVRMKDLISKTTGAKHAANIIEEVTQTA